MISAQSLRIGNFVGMNIAEFPDNYFTVVEPAQVNMKIREGLNAIHGDSMFVYPDDIEGIVLTEEWTGRFGKISWLSLDVGGYFYWFNGEKKYIVFVHTLQNVFFALEQTELK